MSKQLTLSAIAAVTSMAAFALIATTGMFAGDTATQVAGNGPFMELTAAR